MILQTFQGYLYIMSKSVWKVRKAVHVAIASASLVYNNIERRRYVKQGKHNHGKTEKFKMINDEVLDSVSGGVEIR